MRKSAMVGAALITAAAAVAQSPVIEETSARRIGPNGDPAQIVCVSEKAPGSPLMRVRICRTRAEWVELRTQTRQVVERVQSLKTTY